jgi:hypothetical protein
MVRWNLPILHLAGRLASADVFHLLRFQRPSGMIL